LVTDAPIRDPEDRIPVAMARGTRTGPFRTQ